MTIAEVEALLRLLAYMEREELELVMQERREAEREGGKRVKAEVCFLQKVLHLLCDSSQPAS